jgi:hypothetical protein
MSASVNKSTRPALLSVRNAILAATAVLVLSIISACWSMLRPQDSGGLRSDSHGTRRGGYRGLYETLEGLGVTVRRDLAPPRADMNADSTLVMIAPNPQLVDIGPKYVQALLSFVERGGRLVVALPSEGSVSMRGFLFGGKADEHSSRDILELLEVHQQLQRKVVSEPDATNRSLAVSGAGTLAPLSPLVQRISITDEELATLAGDAAELDGSITGRHSDGQEHLLAAAVRRGAGQIIIVSEPRLFSNLHLARNDNAILASHLLTPDGRDVVFDEFYHGLAVRGNPFYLLTRPGFAAVAIGIVLVTGVSTWRLAVFLGPPLPAREASRRDIAEYLDAMGAFFCRGRGHRKFLVREIRNGVLHQLCDDLNLPPDTTDVDMVAKALGRRNHARAGALDKCIHEVDEAAASPVDYPADRFLNDVQRLSELATNQ